jgi:hypothetical protein
MKKVFHFEAPRDRYLCDAAILWCFDSRFELGFHKFLSELGWFTLTHQDRGGSKVHGLA